MTVVILCQSPKSGDFAVFCLFSAGCPQQIWKSPQLMKFHYFEPNVWFFFCILVSCPPIFDVPDSKNHVLGLN